MAGKKVLKKIYYNLDWIVVDFDKINRTTLILSQIFVDIFLFVCVCFVCSVFFNLICISNKNKKDRTIKAYLLSVHNKRCVI